MATKDPDNTPTQVTCPTCQHTVEQAPRTKRTICPNCGNFYNLEAATQPRVNSTRPQCGHVGLPHVNKHVPHVNKHDRERSGGRLGALSNFFQSLGPNKQSKHKNGHGESASVDSGIQSEGSPGTSRAATHSTLPRIAAESRGRLTVDVPGETPSPHSTSASSIILEASGSDGRSHSGLSHGEWLSPLSDALLVNGHSLPTPTGDQQPIVQSTASNKLQQNGAGSPNVAQIKTLEQLQADVKEAQDTDNWKTVNDYYSTTFNSFTHLNAAFKRDRSKPYQTTDDPGLKFDLLYGVYDLLIAVPQDIQKVILKAVINSLLNDKRPQTKDGLRAYVILLQNPQFENVATYVIFAHLLRQVATLQDEDHHFLVHWFKRIEKTRFKQLMNRLHNFISCRLFPPKLLDLPPMAKCTWWIPSATKVLALLNAANNLSQHALLSYLDFYNSSLDHLDLMNEYYSWQNPSSHGGFTFCQYPFMLSIAAKRSILQRDSEQQMIIMARRSLVAKVQRRQLPDIGMLFLNLTVRRSHLVSDSLNEIARKQHDLKKKLKVTFSGEPGLDMGGLTKEWFLLLVRQIFQPEYGMFTYDKNSKVFWFSTSPCENYQEFNLVGVLMGLAVYNSIILDIRFPQCCYKKLLSPAVVPYNNPHATVGVTPLTLSDLNQTMPELAHGLKELLEYEGDVEDDLCMTFQASYTEFDQIVTHTLKPNGENYPVTKKNRKEYIQLYVDNLMNKSIYRQFQAFYHGFHSVCASNALIMLRPEEVEMLVCGNPNLNLMELKKFTTLDGYQASDQTIKHLWEVVSGMSHELQKRFLLFATGSDRVPIGGMSEMTFKITRVENTSMLPVSHTCFNQLVLPAYKSKKTLRTKLIIAVQNAEGFGLE